MAIQRIEKDRKFNYDPSSYAIGKENKIKIAYVCGDAAGPAWYEIFLPVKYMNETGKVYGQMFQGWFNSAPLFNFDIVVFQRQTSNEAYIVANQLKEKGIKTVYHFTDNLWSIPPGNPAREHYGKETQARIEKIIRACDMVTCTTEPLQEIALKYNPYVRRPWEIIEYDEVRKWLPPTRNSDIDNEIRIGWITTPHHEDDVYLVVNSLGQIARKYPNTKFVFFGYFNEALKQSIPTKQIEAYGGIDIETYYEAVTSLDFDIGIAPVVAHPFNFCKSRRKWFEYSIMDVPTICSDYETYKVGMEHMHNCYKVKKNKAYKWTQGLEFLIEHPEERKRLAANAREYVRKNHDVKTHIHKWISMYTELLESNGGADAT